MDKIELAITTADGKVVHEFASKTIVSKPEQKEKFMGELIESLKQSQDNCNQFLTKEIEKINVDNSKLNDNLDAKLQKKQAI